MDLGTGIQIHNAGFKLAENNGNPALMTICFDILTYYIIRLVLKNHQAFLIALWKVILLPISSLSMRMKPKLGWHLSNFQIKCFHSLFFNIGSLRACSCRVMWPKWRSCLSSETFLGAPYFNIWSGRQGLHWKPPAAVSHPVYKDSSGSRRMLVSLNSKLILEAWTKQELFF